MPEIRIENGNETKVINAPDDVAKMINDIRWGIKQCSGTLRKELMQAMKDMPTDDRDLITQKYCQ